MANTVFISYAWDGPRVNARVRALAEDLQRSGWCVWIDVHRIVPGQNLTRTLARGIAQSTVVLMIVSRKYIERLDDPYSNISLEFNSTMGLRKQILPVVVDYDVRAVQHRPCGAFTSCLGDVVYVDGTSCTRLVDAVAPALRKLGVRPSNRRSKRTPPRTVIFL